MARNTNGTGFSLKDHLFNKEKIEYLAGLFGEADKSFDAAGFKKEVMKTLLSLELKQRIVCIAEALEKFLPNDFQEAAAVLVRALPPPLDPTKTDDDFGNFIFAPLGEYVVRNGLSKKNLSLSLKTLKEITKRFSMEDAIRYFINTYEKETMQVLTKWSTDKNYHVRRLVSEGTRPLLPWSGRIGLASKYVVPLLDNLYCDTTRYVTRSVANHMNDIAKQDPDLALKTLKRWKKEGKQSKKEMDWILSHSLRTLIKQGNSKALSLLGYETDPAIAVERFSLKPASKKIAPGEILEFTFQIHVKKNEKLMLDYVIDFVKANGKTTQKVFKIKKLEVLTGGVYEIAKKHRFVKDATTFTLYAGLHRVTLQINGKQFGSKDFTILS